MFHRRKARNSRRKERESFEDDEGGGGAGDTAKTATAATATATAESNGKNQSAKRTAEKAGSGAVTATKDGPVAIPREDDEGGSSDPAEQGGTRKKKVPGRSRRRGFGAAKVSLDDFETRPTLESAPGEYTEEGLRALKAETFASKMEGAPMEFDPAELEYALSGAQDGGEDDPSIAEDGSRARVMRNLGRSRDRGGYGVEDAEAEAAPDFIPLSGGHGSGGERDRLAQLDSDGEMDPLGPIGASGAAVPGGAAALKGNGAADFHDDQPADEEEDQWHYEQLRRAGLAGEAVRAEKNRKLNSCSAVLDEELGNPVHDHAGTIEDVAQRLERRLEAITADIQAITHEISTEEKQAAKAAEDSAKLEDDAHLEQSKQDFFRQLLDYMDNLLEMLSEKAPAVHKQLKLAKRRWHKAGRVRDRRRRKDLLEEATEYGIECDVNLPSESDGSSSSSSRSSSSSSSSGSEGGPKATQAPRDNARELDEFGRDRKNEHDLHVEQRRTRRVERRARRRLHRDADMEDRDGWSTSEDESAPQMLRPEKIMDDVAAEYSELGEILRRLDSWRSAYLESYADAFRRNWIVDLCEPFAEMDLIPWNCFDDPDVGDLSFCRQLERYSESSDYARDSSLVPTIVERTAIPFVEAVVGSWYDARSARQTRATASLYAAMVTFADASGRHGGVERLFNVVLQRFAVARDSVVVSKDAPLDGVSTRFLERQLWAAAKMAKCASLWAGALAGDAAAESDRAERLVELVLRDIVAKSMLPPVRALADVSAQHAIETLAAAVDLGLPDDWPPPEASGWMPVRAFLSRLKGELAPDRPPALVRMLQRCGD